MLMENLSAKTGLTKEQAKKALDAFITSTTKSLNSGKSLALAGVGIFSQDDGQIIFNPDQAMVKAAAHRFAQNYWTSVVFAESDLLREFASIELKGEDLFLESLSFYTETLSKNSDAVKADAVRIAAPFVPGGAVISAAVSAPLFQAIEDFAKKREKGFEFVASSAALLKAADVVLNTLIEEQGKAYLNPKSENLGLTDKQFDFLLKEADLNEKELNLFLQNFAVQMAQMAAQTADGVTIDGLGSFSVSKASAKKVIRFKPGSELTGTIMSAGHVTGTANKTGGKYMGQVGHF
ncbi:HU family DNA-binding protein [Bdellovibrionota bacterium FG-2]